jgi:hypothetical protein
MHSFGCDVRVDAARPVPGADAFAGYIELLIQGSTARLARCAPVAGWRASANPHRRSPARPARRRTQPASRRLQEAAPASFRADGQWHAARGRARSQGRSPMQVLRRPAVRSSTAVGHYRSMQLRVGAHGRPDGGRRPRPNRSPLACTQAQARAGHQPRGASRQPCRWPAGRGGGGQPGDEGTDADRLAFTIRQAIALPRAGRCGRCHAGQLRTGHLPSSAAACASRPACPRVRDRAWSTPTSLAAASAARGPPDAGGVVPERATEAWHALRQQQDAGQMHAGGRPVEVRPACGARSRGHRQRQLRLHQRPDAAQRTGRGLDRL